MYFLRFLFIVFLAISCKKGASSLEDVVVLERLDRRIYIERLILKQEYIIEKKYLFNEPLWKEVELEWKIEGLEEEQKMFKFHEKNLKPISIVLPENIEIPEKLSIEFRLAGRTILLHASLETSQKNKEDEEPVKEPAVGDGENEKSPEKPTISEEEEEDITKED